MTLILSRNFTGTNGDPWGDHGFERVVGSIDAVIASNAGACGASAQERLYAITGYPQMSGHTLACDLDWANAVGAGRAPGLGVRFSRDGADGYVAQIDSNINTTRVRIRRRNAGAWTDVLAWTLVPAVTGLMLNAGVTAALKVENVTGGVRLTLFIDGTQYAQATDTDAARIEGSGLCALYIDSVSTTTDVTYDTVEVNDFESEHATPAALSSGLALVVDGTYYTEAELTAAGVYVTGSRKSLDKGTVGEIRTAQLLDNETGVVYVGALVKVLWNGAVQAYGRVQPSTRRIEPGEGRSYSIVGPRDLAADVLIQHPTTLANSVTWNLPESHAEYDATLDSVSIGTAIQQLFDTQTDGDEGLRAHFAAPPDESVPAYDAAELALLTSAPVGMSASGDVLSAIEQLLALTKYALKIDPDTLVWHVAPRLAGTIRTVALDDDHVLGEYVIDPSRNFTKARLTGERPEITLTTFTNDSTPGTQPLDKGWPAALEATHNSEKALKNTDTGLVASIGGTVGNPTVTRDPVGPPAFTMEADEWIAGTLAFEDGPEAGNTYPVTNNTVPTFTITGPWQAGGPVAGNTFRVTGNQRDGGRDNGHKILGRRFELNDATLGIPSDVCALVKIRQDNIDIITKAIVSTPSDASQKASITLDTPAKGLANYTPEAHTEPCIAGDAGATAISRVEVTLPTYSRTSPVVPMLDEPDPGYTGSAFSYDATKYGTTKRPGKGDVGVMRIYPQHAPEYDGSPAQGAKWTQVLQEILAILSPLSRSVTITINGRIEAGFDVAERLQLSGAGSPSELTTCTDLDILAIEQHYQGGLKTVIFAGSQAAGEYDVQAMRREMQARHGIRAAKRAVNQFQELLNCLKGNTHSAGYEPPPDLTQKCAEQVSSGKTAPGRSAGEDIEILWLLIQELWAWLAEQKGTEGGSDPDGSVWINKDGQWFYTPDGGGTWHEQAANNGPASSGGSGAAPGDPIRPNPKPTKPDDLGAGSIEGIMWEAIQGILANLGKTIDLETGRLIAPGTVNNATNNPDGNPWITFGPSVTPGGPPTRTPVGGGGVVPPANETPKKVMQNLLKTQVPDGDIPDPGDVVPDGANFYGPLGVVPIPVGDYAPASLLTHLFGSKRLKGLAVHDAGDAGGIVFEHPSGSLFRVEAVGYATTPMLKQVEAVGAGTGQNAGDYDTPASNVETLAPSERIDFTEAEGDGIDPEVADDGQGLMLRDAVTSSIIAGPVMLPSGSKGYADGSMQVVVTVRGDQAGGGTGNYLVRLYGTLHEDGASSGAEFQIGADFVVANPGNSGESATVEGRLDALAGGPHAPGMRLSVRVERVGADGLDTATDRLDVLAVHVDVPVQAQTIGSEDYS